VAHPFSEAIKVCVESRVENVVVDGVGLTRSTLGFGIITVLTARIGRVAKQRSLISILVVHLCTPSIGWYPLSVPAQRLHLEQFGLLAPKGSIDAIDMF